jgi:hypothetical protein
MDSLTIVHEVDGHPSVVGEVGIVGDLGAVEASLEPGRHNRVHRRQARQKLGLQRQSVQLRMHGRVVCLKDGWQGNQKYMSCYTNALEDNNATKQ